MRTRRTPVSCGANQLYGLQGINSKVLEGMLVQEYRQWGQRSRLRLNLDLHALDRPRDDEYDDKIYAGETVIFSDNDSYKNGRKLAALIRAHKLGEVVSLSGVNPNTRSKITTYLWRYNGGKVLPVPRKKTASKERVVLE